MSTQNEDLVRRWFAEVWNQGRESAIDELLASDALVDGLGEPGKQIRGPEGFKPFFRRFQAAFTDIQITVDQTIAEGEWVASRWTARMTHRGDQLGVAPTGARVLVTGMSMAQFRDGRMIAAYNSWDQLALMEQTKALTRQVQLLD